MRDPGRLGRLRVAGVTATGLLTAGAFGAGALPGTADGAANSAGRNAADADPSSWAYWANLPPGYWVGLVAWACGLVLLSVTWWRLGGLLRRAPEAVPLRGLLVTGALWAMPLLLAPPLASRDVYSYACQGALWLDGADPYQVGAAAGGCGWWPAVAPDWRDTPAPYGPLAIGVAGAAVAAARAVSGSEQTQLLVVVALLRVVALAGALLIAGYAPRLARACGVDPVAASWLALLSPLVAIHLVGGAHNDALMVGLVVAALAAAASGPRRPWLPPAPLAGAALGAAISVKVTAMLAVPFAILLATATTNTGPGPGRLRRVRLGWTTVRVVGAATLVYLALTVTTGLDLGWIAALSETGQLVQWTSLPTGLGMAAGYLWWLAGHPAAVPTAVAVARAVGAVTLAVGVTALVGAVAVGVLRGAAVGSVALRRRAVTACGLAFSAFALLTPVFYPWYAVPAIAVLAAGVTGWRWRRRLAVAALALTFLVLPDGLGLAVLTKVPGALLDLVLVSGAAVLVGRRLAQRTGRRSDRETGRSAPS